MQKNYYICWAGQNQLMVTTACIVDIPHKAQSIRIELTFKNDNGYSLVRQNRHAQRYSNNFASANMTLKCN